MHRRSILQRGAALALLAACGAAHAADYPTKPMTMIVPQATGGTNDVVARIVAQKLGEALGGSVVVDNRPGAGGNIGTVAAARAAKDGYTLLMTVSSAQAINPALYKAPGFDPVKDFAPVALVGCGAERAGGPPVVSREDARRLPQAGEVQARHVPVRLGGQRHAQPPARARCSRPPPASTCSTFRTRVWRPRSTT